MLEKRNLLSLSELPLLSSTCSVLVLIYHFLIFCTPVWKIKAYFNFVFYFYFCKGEWSPKTRLGVSKITKCDRMQKLTWCRLKLVLLFHEKHWNVQSVIIQIKVKNLNVEMVNCAATLHFSFSSLWFSITTSHDMRLILLLRLLKSCFKVFHENKVAWYVRTF